MLIPRGGFVADGDGAAVEVPADIANPGAEVPGSVLAGVTLADGVPLTTAAAFAWDGAPNENVAGVRDGSLCPAGAAELPRFNDGAAVVEARAEDDAVPVPVTPNDGNCNADDAPAAAAVTGFAEN